MRHQTLTLAILCAFLTLAACSDDTTAPLSQQPGEESLPQPGATGGSVTGMPNPGTPSALPPPADTMATDDEDPGIATEDGAAFDPNLPMNPPETGAAGEMSTPLPDTMPTMPAPVPDPIEATTTPPPQS